VALQLLIVQKSVHLYFSSAVYYILTLQQWSASGLHFEPVLFTILLDPCLVNCASTKLVCYADDCTVLHKVFPNEVDSPQEKASKFIIDAKTQRLEMNAAKCQVIHFLRKPSLPITPPVLVLKSDPLTPVNSVKILGIWFTSDLKWTTHLQCLQEVCLVPQISSNYFIVMA
jgi:hypothetical protein